MMVVLDSISRRQFFKRLEKVVSFINEVGNLHQVFDFKIHNVLGEFSHSFMPLFFG